MISISKSRLFLHATDAAILGVLHPHLDFTSTSHATVSIPLLSCLCVAVSSCISRISSDAVILFPRRGGRKLYCSFQSCIALYSCSFLLFLDNHKLCCYTQSLTERCSAAFDALTTAHSSICEGGRDGRGPEQKREREREAIQAHWVRQQQKEKTTRNKPINKSIQPETTGSVCLFGSKRQSVSLLSNPTKMTKRESGRCLPVRCFWIRDTREITRNLLLSLPHWLLLLRDPKKEQLLLSFFLLADLYRHIRVSLVLSRRSHRHLKSFSIYWLCLLAHFVLPVILHLMNMPDIRRPFVPGAMYPVDKSNCEEDLFSSC